MKSHAEKYGPDLRAWRALDRLRCSGFRNDKARGGLAGHVELVEVFVYGKSAKVTRRITVREE
jgi:hypothetical protein